MEVGELLSTRGEVMQENLVDASPLDPVQPPPSPALRRGWPQDTSVASSPPPFLARLTSTCGGY